MRFYQLIGDAGELIGVFTTHEKALRYQTAADATDATITEKELPDYSKGEIYIGYAAGGKFVGLFSDRIAAARAALGGGRAEPAIVDPSPASHF